MDIYSGDKGAFTRYESLDELLSAVSTSRKWPMPDRSSDTGAESFTGTPSFDAAMGLARHGWEDGLKNLAKVSSVVSHAAGFATAPVEMYDVAGAYPIAALAAAGEPACMVAPVPLEDRKRPIIRILIEGAYSAMYGTQEVINFGAAVLCLVDALENQSFRCEVAICWNGRSMSQEYSSVVTVKHAQDAADMGRFAFALGHPSMLRRIWFGEMERHMPLHRGFVSGYGSVSGANNKVFPWRDPDQIYIPGVNAIGRPGSPELKTGTAALAALEPVFREACVNRDMVIPPLWGRDYR